MLTLIAAPQTVIQTLAGALRDLHAEVRPGRTTAEAESHLATKLDLILVCYVFDELHPYRFIRRIKVGRANSETPLILVRALPVPLGESQEGEIRQAYESIGVDAFINYSRLVEDTGSARADEALRQSILKLVRLPSIRTAAASRP